MTDPFSDARSSRSLNVDMLRAYQHNAEAQLVDTFGAECAAELEVADTAAAFLLGILHAAAPETTKSVVELDEDDLPIGGDTESVRVFALVLMGIRGWRAMRASRAVLAIGYEVESRAYERILMELMAHRKAVLDDPRICHEAIRWITSERKWSIGKQVDALGAEGLYGELCHDAHGDATGAMRLLHQESGSFLVGPARTHAARACLLLHAGFAYDHSTIIAELAGIPVNGAEPLEAMIRDEWSKLNEQIPAAPDDDAGAQPAGDE